MLPENVARSGGGQPPPLLSFFALFRVLCREPQKLQNDVHTRSTQARWWNRTHPIYPGHYCNVTCPFDVSIVEVLME